MPLALEHIAIGLVVQQYYGFSPLHWKKQSLAIVVLANAPDLDVIPGIIFQNDWGYYHRLASHSLVYSLIFGCLFALAYRRLFRYYLIPPVIASAIVFSHVLSDYLLSPWPVELFWPFNVALPYSHHHLLLQLGLTDDMHRNWFILAVCLAISGFLYFRSRLAYRYREKNTKPLAHLPVEN